MRCKKCNLQITDSDETVCPLCNTPLEEDEQSDQELQDKVYKNQELKELITSIADTVKKSFDKDKFTTRDDGKASFDLEKALSSEEAAVFIETASSAVQITEYDKSNKSSINKLFALSLVVLAVIGFVSVAYFYASHEPNTAKQTIIMPDKVPSLQDKPAAQPESTIPSEQPKEAAGQLQGKAEQAAVTVSTAAPELKKEQVPEQKPDKRAPQKIIEPANITASVPFEFYTVNVGSYKYKKSVDWLKKVLTKKGYAPAVETVTLNDNSTWYRVNVGQFKTREDAARLAQELAKKQKLETTVVKKK